MEEGEGKGAYEFDGYGGGVGEEDAASQICSVGFGGEDELICHECEAGEFIQTFGWLAMYSGSLGLPASAHQSMESAYST